MKRKEKITFAPEGLNNKRSVPRYVPVIVGAAVVFALLSFLAILAMNDFDFNKVLGIRKQTLSSETETTTDDTSSVSLADLTESVNFLVICSQDKNIDFCQVISVSPAENKIRVKPIDPLLRIGTEGAEKPLADVFVRDGIREVCAGLEARGIPVARYALISETNFVSLIQKLGAVNIMLEGAFEFNVDAIRYTFDAGLQTMNADALLRYMAHVSSGDERLRLQAEAAASVISTHFTRTNADKGDSFFSELINLVDTDITVFDYTSAVSVIRTMLEGKTEISVIS